MANHRKPRQEDPNAETQPRVAAPGAQAAPNAPQAPNPQGGAPEVKTQYFPHELAPGQEGVMKTFLPEGPRRPDAMEFGEIVNAYNKGVQQARLTPAVHRTPARPWRADARQTDLGRLYRQRLDAENIGHEKPPWTVKDVQANEPEFVSGIRDKLWAKYQSLPASEKSDIFWQGVAQNPEYAAASMVRRMLFNTQQSARWMTGEETPKLEDAVRNTLELSDTWRWLNWVQGTGEKPAKGSAVTPPSAAQAGLEEVIRLREQRGQ